MLCRPESQKLPKRIAVPINGCAKMIRTKFENAMLILQVIIYAFGATAVILTVLPFLRF